jgi:hypothetical protein
MDTVCARLDPSNRLGFRPSFRPMPCRSQKIYNGSRGEGRRGEAVANHDLYQRSALMHALCCATRCYTMLEQGCRPRSRTTISRRTLRSSARGRAARVRRNHATCNGNMQRTTCSVQHEKTVGTGAQRKTEQLRSIAKQANELRAEAF